MEIKIVNGESKYLEDCYDALIKSEIGRTYFLSFDSRKMLISGLDSGEIDVALDKDGTCLGFIWYQRHGAFEMHTYLHIIAVKEEYRGQGIGKKMIANFEETTFESDNMIFLMVAGFNSEARKLYKSLGYTLVGIIPGFYRKGVDEYLMMKTKP
jgi:ribosomal protein S18 acetylase RimI-like enzyme